MEQTKSIQSSICVTLWCWCWGRQQQKPVHTFITDSTTFSQPILAIHLNRRSLANHNKLWVKKSTHCTHKAIFALFQRETQEDSSVIRRFSIRLTHPNPRHNIDCNRYKKCFCNAEIFPEYLILFLHPPLPSMYTVSFLREKHNINSWAQADTHHITDHHTQKQRQWFSIQ